MTETQAARFHAYTKKTFKLGLANNPMHGALAWTHKLSKTPI